MTSLSPDNPPAGSRPREILGRFAASDRAVLWTMFAVFVAIRWPLRSSFLVNWDAVNFALGVTSFDLEHHQPHPPGYIGYVAVGRLLSVITGDANTALTALSVLAGAALPVAAFLLARRMMDRRWALLTAVMLGTSPVVWYYSVVALTYVVSGALVTFLVWAAHVARGDGSTRHLYLAAALAGVLGSIRQTDLVFMVPLLVFAAWPFAWRYRLRATAALGAVTVAWFVPLMVMSGGLGRFLTLSRELAALAGGRTIVLGMNPVGILQNLGLVTVGLVLGLNLALLVFPAARLHRVRVWQHLPRDDRRMLLLWVVPALFTFLFIHTGQIGYVLFVLPAAMLIAGAVLGRIVEVRQAGRPAMAPRFAHAGASAAGLMLLAVVLVASNAIGFFAYPATARSLMVPSDNATSPMAEALVQDGGVAERTRQFDLGVNDEYWAVLTALIESFDTDTTVALSTPDSGGSFRHLAFYTPDHRLYSIGPDLRGRTGHLFTAWQGHSDYTVEGLERAHPVLVLPPDVTTLVVPERVLRNRLVGEVRPYTGDDLSDAEAAVVYEVPAGSRLVFETDRTAGPLIRVEGVDGPGIAATGGARP
jgi:hypothetical protein